jgi:hypothetical protein
VWISSDSKGPGKIGMIVNELRLKRSGLQRPKRSWYFERFGKIGDYVIKSLNLLTC